MPEHAAAEAQSERRGCQRGRREGGYGYNWWFQCKLGQLVREHGMRVCMRDEHEWDAPHFVPKRQKVMRTSPILPKAKCDGDQLVRAETVPKTWNSSNHPATYWFRKGDCALCKSIASAAGTVTHTKTLMPDGKKTVPRPSTMCKKCHRYLCEACNAKWDHEHNQPPQQASPCER